MRTEIEKIKHLVTYLNQACEAYYKYDDPIMSDKEYDELFDKLVDLEKETGIILSNSPTQNVQGYILENLKKVKHSKPMLSATKTKNIDDIKKFINDRNFYTSYKLDGLTLVVKYNNGILQQAITRGTGIEGEDVTEQAKCIYNLPIQIPYKGYLELRGECVISWKNFNNINIKLNLQYKHPRNLAAGSLRNLDTNITKERNLEYVVFECVSDFYSNNKIETLKAIENLGFTVAGCCWGNIDDCIETMKPEYYEYPVDGLIFELNDKEISKSLGATMHHENCRIALKWEDTVYETILRDVEWNTTRTGVINPVAVFDEIDLDGALTTKATLHNINYIKDLQLGIGDTITVYRSNMVIPKIHENLTKSNTLQIPTTCPICGKPTEIKKENKSEVLYCSNPNCKGKLLGKFVNFCSKPAMNIEGLSEATLEKFIDKGYLQSFVDIYHLDKYKDEIINMEGFGVKSWNNHWNAIQTSRDIKLENFLVALGIPNVGKTASKTISKYCNGDFDTFIRLYENNFDWTSLQDFGIVLSKSINDYLNNMDLFNDILYISQELRFITNKVNQNKENPFTNKTVVVTGSLQNFSRSEIQSKLEELGAKVSNSISKKTDYLICGENAGSKLTKAKVLNITILFEKEFLELIK